MSGLTIRDGLEFVCPFCQGQCTASLEQECVVHSEPTCKTFDELEIDEFLHQVNERRRRSRS